MAYEISIFVLKCVLITLFIDGYLYLFHSIFHSKYAPTWLRRIHARHHTEFKTHGIFNLHPVEFAINFIPGALFVYWLVGLWFIPIVTFWAVFEAARGHGHFLWLRIPKAYYRACQFCGIKYHLYHHEIDETKNLGQMLKVWDVIVGTKATGFK